MTTHLNLNAEISGAKRDKACESHLTGQQLSQLMPTAPASGSGKPQKHLADDWFKQWLTQIEFVVKSDGTLTIKGNQVTQADVEEECFLDGIRTFHFWNEKLIKTRINRLIASQKTEALKSLRNLIQGDGHYSNEPLERLVAMMNLPSQEQENAEISILQWCLQVKRYALGLPVQRPMMLILHGPQDTGKTMMVNHLASPFDSVGKLLRSSADVIFDNRSFNDLADNFVVFLDELAKLDRTDSATLKRSITESTASGRAMRTNGSTKMKKVASFIGATNSPVEDIIKDASGMSRFLVVNIPSKMDVGGFIKFDWGSFWRSIDPNMEEPRKKFEEKIKARQESLRTKTTEELFLDEICPGEEKRFVSYDDLWVEFSKFSKRISGHGKTFGDRNSFVKKMKNMGLPLARTKHERGFFVAEVKNSPSFGGDEDAPLIEAVEGKSNIIKGRF